MDLQLNMQIATICKWRHTYPNWHFKKTSVSFSIFQVRHDHGKKVRCHGDGGVKGCHTPSFKIRTNDRNYFVSVMLLKFFM